MAKTKSKLNIFLTLIFVFAIHSLQAIPVVTSVSPVSGPAAGGTLVTITGSGFTGATVVNFDFKTAVPTVINDTTIQVVSPLNVFGAMDVTVTTPSGTSAINRPGDYFTYTGTWTAYVPDFGSHNVIPIDIIPPLYPTGTHIAVGSEPNDVAFVPSGRLAITANSGANMLSIIDVATGTVVFNFNVPGMFPILAVTANGENLAVCNFNSNNVTIFNMNNLTGTNIDVGTKPTGVAMTMDNHYAYVANSSSPFLSRIDLTDLTAPAVNIDIPQPVTGNYYASFIEITPDGKTALLSYDSANTLQVFYLPSETFGPLIQGCFSIDNGTYFPEIAISPDGTTGYITNTNSDTIQVIEGLNTPTPTCGASYTVESNPNGIALTPDGAFAFVSNGGSGSETVVNLMTGEVTEVLVGITPTDTGITPDQAPVAYFTATPAPSGSATTFDASASVSPVGSIATYTWNFGDGSAPVTTTSPTISHDFATSGAYAVSLTVTNTAGTSTTQLYTGQVMLKNGGPSAQLSQTINIPPSPSNGFRGHCARDRFLTQNDNLIKLFWHASSDPTVVEYQLFRDGKRIATLPASRHKFIDHNRHRHKVYTYTLVIVSSSGLVSQETIKVGPCHHHHHKHKHKHECEGW